MRRPLQAARSAFGPLEQCAHGPRSGLPVPPAVRLRHRVPHPAAGVHRRPRVVHRAARGPARHEARYAVPAAVDLLDAHLRGFIRHGCRVGHRDAVPVRHQLEPLLGRDGNVLGPLFAYEGLSRSSSKRGSSASCCSAASACRRGRISSPPSWWPWERCSRLSGSWPRTAGCRRRAATSSSTGASCPRLARRDLQCFVPVPPRAHGHRLSTSRRRSRCWAQPRGT